MKKKVLSMILAVALTASCGAYSVGAEETTAVAEVSVDVNEYGFTQEQQEALLESVKTTVTDGYLNKYGIVPKDFQIRAFDANDLGNYDSSGAYTGEDPYQFASAWDVIDRTIWNKDNLCMYAVTGLASGDESGDVFLSSVDEYVFADTLEAQNEENKEKTGGRIVFDNTPEKDYDLANALYMGIAQFLNSMEKQDRAELVYRLYVMEVQSEKVEVNGMEYVSQTMFDRVISENIRF